MAHQPRTGPLSFGGACGSHAWSSGGLSRGAFAWSSAANLYGYGGPRSGGTHRRARRPRASDGALALARYGRATETIRRSVVRVPSFDRLYGSRFLLVVGLQGVLTDVTQRRHVVPLTERNHARSCAVAPSCEVSTTSGSRSSPAQCAWPRTPRPETGAESRQRAWGVGPGRPAWELASGVRGAAAAVDSGDGDVGR